jgi:uncharacterized protein YcbX
MQILTEIWRYPVKSCGGNALQFAKIDEYGLVGDRLFVIATHAGRILTQKTLARLNLISVTYRGRDLKLSATGAGEVTIDPGITGPSVSVELYDGPAPGVCMGDAAAHWLSSFLGKTCRLVQSREIFGRRMPPIAAHLFLPEQKRYPDCAPILLIAYASLRDLNERLELPVEMSRFRPNLVIDGVGPYAEDDFRTIRVGQVTFDYMGPCERCGMTLIAPGTDRRGTEPLKTLRTYRLIPTGLDSGIAFGAYFKPREPGEIKVGDAVEILSR